MNNLKDNIDIVNKIMDKYEIDNDDRLFIWQNIEPIFNHPEFQKRMNVYEFAHHDMISVGYHIISDAVYTFKICKKKQISKDKTKTALLIAMFHDLYEYPWQNSKRIKKKFINSHALVHPIEAAINAYIWFPQYFENINQAKIILDGIIHHMYPWPVRAIDDSPIHLNNENKYLALNPQIKELIIKSSLRYKLGHISFGKCQYLEGKIMCKADKIISLIKDISFNGLKTCVTGKNQNLIRRKK